MIAVTEVFKALSDPVRLEMVRRLSEKSDFTLNSISSDLGVTRQGARKHLLVLEQAHIITLRKTGRKKEVQLNTSSLSLVKDFILKLEHQWDQRLFALKKFVEEKEAK